MIASVDFAIVLVLAGLLGIIASRTARPASRTYFALAAVLYAALAVADVITNFVPGTQSFAEPITLLVCALGPVALSVSLFASFAHPPKSWMAALLLVFAMCAGIGAAILGTPALSFAVLIAAICAMLALAARRYTTDKRGAFHAIIASVCFVAGASAGAMNDAAGTVALMLFSAAGLLGIALALARPLRKPVAEQSRKDLRFAAIGGGR
jgi:hypothetical protein